MSSLFLVLYSSCLLLCLKQLCVSKFSPRVAKKGRRAEISVIFFLFPVSVFVLWLERLKNLSRWWRQRRGHNNNHSLHLPQSSFSAISSGVTSISFLLLIFFSLAFSSSTSFECHSFSFKRSISSLYFWLHLRLEAWIMIYSPPLIVVFEVILTTHRSFKDEKYATRVRFTATIPWLFMSSSSTPRTRARSLHRETLMMK